MVSCIHGADDLGEAELRCHQPARARMRLFCLASKIGSAR
jgi:hypothetical protein